MKSGNIELTGTIKIGHFTTAQRNALTPELGTEIYNTDSNVIEYWNGTQWSVNVYNVTGSGGITINTSAPGFINVNGTGIIGVLSAGSGISLTNNVITIDFYVTQKLSSDRWKIRDQYGSITEDISEENAYDVVYIRKSFESLEDAIGGTSSCGISDLFGTTNLITKKKIAEHLIIFK
jgi:hypothetical protein